MENVIIKNLTKSKHGVLFNRLCRMIKTFPKNNLPKNFLKSDVRSEGNFSVFYFFDVTNMKLPRLLIWLQNLDFARAR